MKKRRANVTCEDCYFRQEDLCALPSIPCPTFRAATAGVLAPPRQARLVPRPLAPATVGQAA